MDRGDSAGDGVVARVGFQIYRYGISRERVLVLVVWFEVEGYALGCAASMWAKGFRVKCVGVCSNSVELSSRRAEECGPTGAEPARGREPGVQGLLKAEVDSAWAYSAAASKEEC